MKFFTPQVRLIRRLHFDGPDSFILHAVTFCSHTNFRANGFSPIPTGLDEKGCWNIGIHILRDENLPDCYSLTPVVHTLVLDNPPFGESGGEICINLFVNGLATTRGTVEETTKKPKTKTTVRTTDADEDSRPMDEF